MTMAPELWPLDPAGVDNNYKQRHPDEPLPRSFIWATWTAAGSDYLNKLDADSDAPHDSGLIDISHVRWATMNAITAIDLCAATLGRMFCGVKGANRSSTHPQGGGTRTCNAATQPLLWSPSDHVVKPSRLTLGVGAATHGVF